MSENKSSEMDDLLVAADRIIRHEKLFGIGPFPQSSFGQCSEPDVTLKNDAFAKVQSKVSSKLRTCIRFSLPMIENLDKLFLKTTGDTLAVELFDYTKMDVERVLDSGASIQVGSYHINTDKLFMIAEVFNPCSSAALNPSDDTLILLSREILRSVGCLNDLVMVSNIDEEACKRFRVTIEVGIKRPCDATVHVEFASK